MAELLDDFVRLFRGRGDARGSWNGPAIREPLTPDHFARHLHSRTPDGWMGVYNVIGTRCSWGCVDIDTDDYPLACNIRNALAQRHVPGWIEQTTRGYHVWVFPADALVEAATMRHALTAACLAVGYSPKEVFPKQAKVAGGGLGNFVRLPYNGFLAGGDHVPRMMVDHHLYELRTNEFPFHALLMDIDENRAPTPALQALAALIPCTQSVDISVDMQGEVSDPPVDDLGGLAYVIWRDGPLPGSDRSTIMVHLAYLLAEQDMPARDALAVLADVDLRWGKRFMDRGDRGRVILTRIIEKAYA